MGEEKGVGVSGNWRGVRTRLGKGRLGIGSGLLIGSIPKEYRVDPNGIHTIVAMDKFDRYQRVGVKKTLVGYYLFEWAPTCTCSKTHISRRYQIKLTR